MSEIPSLMSQMLLSVKIMTEAELLELQTLVNDLMAKFRQVPTADGAHEYEYTAKVALTDLDIDPLNIESITQSLADLNPAELKLVSMEIFYLLRCDDVPDGTTASEVRHKEYSGGPISVPVRGPVKRDDENHRKRGEVLSTAHREFRAGNKEKALAILDLFIQTSEEERQPTFLLRMERELMFFHQPGDYSPGISLCEQHLAVDVQDGDLFAQLETLETLAFAALRMGQKQKAADYLDQLETSMTSPSPDHIAQATADFGYDTDSKIHSLLEYRVKSAKQLRKLLTY